MSLVNKLLGLKPPKSQVADEWAADISPLPRHVAIIMDGNGRWASVRNLPTIEGHRAGTENIRRIIQTMCNCGIKCLTLYAFSTENWLRPSTEIRGLFQILREVIERETGALHEAGVQVRHIGSLEKVPFDLREAILGAVRLTQHNERMILCIAFNYGGRHEIVEAVKRIIIDAVPAEAVDESIIRKHLYASDIPDPDLVIRTAGEMRLSNFLIWQAAYAEYYMTETLWPDFDLEALRKALIAFSQRQRRFGGHDSK